MKAFRLLFALVLLLPLHALHAQVEERALMSVHIPFAFTVDNARLPAGDYVIYSELGHEWKLASFQRGGNTFFHITPDEIRALPGQSKLIFRRYETEYVLSEIDDGSTKIKATLAAGKREKQLLHGNAQPEIAVIYDVNQMRASGR
ncbi:MAG TPA: hypothetical protein VKX41_02120 [Alloacidobacterium sp.]|jgi:hypothetical protein|nr:hypothetical protein [Alloacidobacterium sp.]